MPFDYKNTLRARWSKREKDIIIDHPNGPDGHLLYDFMRKGEIKNFLKELEERGYDLSTFQIRVLKKKMT